MENISGPPGLSLLSGPARKYPKIRAHCRPDQTESFLLNLYMYVNGPLAHSKAHHYFGQGKSLVGSGCHKSGHTV